MYCNLTKRKLRIESEVKRRKQSPHATNKHQDPFEHPERLPDLHDRGEWFVRAESSMHRPNGRWKRPAPQNFPVSFLRAIVCKTQFDSHDHQPRNEHQRILPPTLLEGLVAQLTPSPPTATSRDLCWTSSQYETTDDNLRVEME